MHKYKVIIYWSNEDGAFVAEVPELPGCSAHGDTQQAALEQIGQAMDLWLETVREEECPQRIGTRRPFVVILEHAWRVLKEGQRKALGQWLVENTPRGTNLTIPDRNTKRKTP